MTEEEEKKAAAQASWKDTKEWFRWAFMFWALLNLPGILIWLYQHRH